MRLLNNRGTRIVAASAALLIPLAVAPPASAQPTAGSDSAAASTGSYLDRIETIDDRQVVAHVYSASMDRVIPLKVILPADTSEPRPTLYLLNGAGGGEDAASWYEKTDIVEFFADKNVNVVTPIGGAFSYYTDWQKEDPELGRNMWETFLTRELPPIIDSALDTTGANAIAGLSSSATSVLNLAIAGPGLYRAVGSYSGCASTSDDLGQAYVKTVVARGGGDVENMWGPDGDPDWVEHDAIINAEKLRGTALYISSGTGLPGREDNPAGQNIDGRLGVLANQVVVGGIIEAATNECTHRLENRLHELGIPAHVVYRPGTHSWGYWQEDLHKSWPLFESVLY